jgi:hypothetical protein
MASTYLSRTPASSGNLKTWTFSAWFKKGSGGYLFGAGDMSDGDPSVAIEVGTTIEFRVYAGGHISRLVPTQVTRDNSAWYHYVVAVDTTQGTASNRVKVYINGTQVTSFSTEDYMSQNYDTVVNSSSYTQRVGDRGGGNFDGCMAHVHLIDGTAYDASDFGQTDATTGIWKPKTSPSVTYGTNGFFLKFENLADMDLDSSPNNLTFSTSGTLTQTVDTPSNVFAVMNVLNPQSSGLTIANGNLSITSNASSAWRSIPITLGVSSGKWYWETKVTNFSVGLHIGMMDYEQVPQTNTYAYQFSRAYMYKDDGDKANNGVNTAYGDSFTAGDIIGVAMDLDNNKIYWSKNGTWQNGGDPTSGATGTGSAFDIASEYTYTPISSTNSSSDLLAYNFGNGYFGTTAVSSAGSNGNGAIFEYDVPTGYYALNTKNINTYG